MGTQWDKIIIGIDPGTNVMGYGLLGILVDDQVGEGDVSAFGCKFQGNCLSDSTGCSGDQGNLSV